MNLISYLILAVLIVCFVLAVRYTRKHGSCESCGGNHDRIYHAHRRNDVRYV